MVRLIVSIVGLIAIFFLIWFGGPMIAINEAKPLEGVAARLLTMLLILLVWSIVTLIKFLKSNQITKELLEGLSKSKKEKGNKEEAPVNDGSSAEVSVLQQNFNEALHILNRSRLGGQHGEHKLYELPWYIIIGPPGAGKTTALINSGLRFPLAGRFGQQAMRGIGGTRDCDWWFTDEAVLIDTAGRYTTQDSDSAVDSAGWHGFLNLLKKHRQRQPINGVMVAISLSELLTQNETERSAHAAAIKRRIQELNEKLGINFPIYVLFTKIDLIAGFVEYFDDLSREERDQVWGFTFNFEAAMENTSSVEQFSAYFDNLIQQLNARTIPRLHQERDQRRRTLIHGFPHQLASIKPAAERFLQEIFRPNRFEDAFLLRGVYFTSGTQEGNPIDRVMGALAATFGLDRQHTPSFSGQGRSYFLTRLFRDVIFEEAGIAGSDKRVEQRRTWFQYGVYASAVIAILSATLIWSGSYATNSQHISNMKKNLVAYKKEASELSHRSDVFDTLSPLQSLKKVKDEYKEESWAWLTGLALSKQGSLEPKARAAYKAAIIDEFLPRLVKRLETQMRLNENDTEILNSNLKVYLMMAKQEHRNPEFIKYWMDVDWQQVFPNEPDKQAQLKGHLDTLLAMDFPAPKLNDRLVRTTRAILNRVPIEKRVYARLKQEGIVESGLTYRLSDALNEDGRRTFRSLSNKGLRQQISGLYTKTGYKNLYLDRAPKIARDSTDETWVLGDQQAETPSITQKELNERVQRFYVNDYIDNWNVVLEDLDIVKFDDIRHGVQVVEILAGANSPLRTLLESVEKNTGLNRKLPTGDTGLKKLDSKLKKLKKVAEKNQSKFDRVGPDDLIGNSFVSLNKLVIPHKPDGGAAPLDDLLALLAELHTYLDELASDTSGLAAFQAAKDRMVNGSKDPIGKLRSKATRLPQPVKRWMMTAATESWRVILGNTRRYINSAWQSEVLPEYDRRLKGRYPLIKATEKEMTISDFARFFGPDGTMDAFFANYLQPFLKKSRNGIVQRSFEHQALGLSQSSLNALKSATHIKNIYFAGGDPTPLVPFKMKPLYLDAAISKFSFEIDGQQIDYRHGPTRASKLQWPGPDGPGRARITFEATTGSRMSRTKEGPWGLFRMLDQAELKSTNVGDRVKVTFNMNGHQARYELQADSVENPFRLKSLENFRAPERL